MSVVCGLLHGGMLGGAHSRRVSLRESAYGSCQRRVRGENYMKSVWLTRLFPAELLESVR